MFDGIISEAGLVARQVQRFNPQWLYSLPEDAQRTAFQYLDNLWSLEARSSEMWLVTDGEEPVFFVGVIPYSLIGASSYVWTFPFKGFKAKHARPIKRMIEANKDRFVMLTAQVPYGLSRSERFAEFFGFKPQYALGDMIVYVRDCR